MCSFFGARKAKKVFPTPSPVMSVCDSAELPPPLKCAVSVTLPDSFARLSAQSASSVMPSPAAPFSISKSSVSTFCCFS